MNEIERLKAALKWAMASGVHANSEGQIESAGCGCCAYPIDNDEIPAEFRDEVLDACRPSRLPGQ